MRRAAQALCVALLVVLAPECNAKGASKKKGKGIKIKKGKGPLKPTAGAASDDNRTTPTLGSDGIFDLTDKTFFSLCGGSDYVFVMFKQDGCSACAEDAPTLVELAKAVKGGFDESRLNAGIMRRVKIARVTDDEKYGPSMVDLFKIEFFPAYRLCIPNFSKRDVNANSSRWFQHGRDGAVLKVAQALDFMEEGIQNYEDDGLYAITGNETQQGVKATRDDSVEELTPPKMPAFRRIGENIGEGDLGPDPQGPLDDAGIGDGAEDTKATGTWGADGKEEKGTKDEL